VGEKAFLAECIESKGRKRWVNSVCVLAFLQRIAQAGEHDGPYFLKRWDLMKESCSSHFPLFSTVTGYFFLVTLCRPGSHAFKPSPPQKDGPVMRQMFL